jgi:hypothetical protein
MKSHFSSISFFTLWFVFMGCYNSHRSNNPDTLTIGDNSCPLEGIADSEKDSTSNRLKNRWRLPSDSDIDTSFNWENIYQDGGDPRRFDQQKAGKLRGYVALVTLKKEEECNCNIKDKDFYDIHIHLSPSLEAISQKWQHVIVEVTPRLRKLMNGKNDNFSLKRLKELKKEGIEVEIEGWLFYDWEHGDKAYLYNGDEQKSWRVSAWEIHPITSLKEVE